MPADLTIKEQVRQPDHYTAVELRQLLGVSRQRIHQLAEKFVWRKLPGKRPARYQAEDVMQYMSRRKRR